MSRNYLKYWLNFSLSFRARVREQLAFRPHLFLVLVSSSLWGDSILIHENPMNKTFLLHVVMVPFRQRWYSKCLPTAQHGTPEQWSEDLWLLDGEEPGLVSEDRAGVSGSRRGDFRAEPVCQLSIIIAAATLLVHPGWMWDLSTSQMLGQRHKSCGNWWSIESVLSACFNRPDNWPRLKLPSKCLCLSSISFPLFLDYLSLIFLYHLSSI